MDKMGRGEVGRGRRTRPHRVNRVNPVYSFEIEIGIGGLVLALPGWDCDCDCDCRGQEGQIRPEWRLTPSARGDYTLEGVSARFGGDEGGVSDFACEAFGS